MPIKFTFTPEEARPIAKVVARWVKKHHGHTCTVERPAWPAAPYRTTLVSKSNNPKILVEAQGRMNYHRSLAELRAWISDFRHHAELYLAVPAEGAIDARGLEEMRSAGVGLLLVDDKKQVSVSFAARSPALIVTPDPTLRYGDCTDQTLSAIAKFNTVDRRDGLRDMCELVERETERLAIAASRRGRMNISESAITAMDWSSQINALASAKAASPRTPLMDEAMKNDYHSFRGARNLVDHPARTKRDAARRERQYAERMTQGPRLIAELVSLRRQVTRKTKSGK